MSMLNIAKTVAGGIKENGLGLSKKADDQPKEEKLKPVPVPQAPAVQSQFNPGAGANAGVGAGVASDRDLKNINLSDRIRQWENNYALHREKESRYAKVRELAANVISQAYTYKPESGEDPTVQHEGPMAQDIKKVYPDAVSDERPYKVDAGRLALDITGTMAEMSRMMINIEKQIKQLQRGAA